MKKILNLVILLCFLLLAACQPSAGQAPVENGAALETKTSPATVAGPTLAPVATATLPPGKDILVSTTDDSGPGSLRQALSDAQTNDRILFDPMVFPPDAPAIIQIKSGLPELLVPHVSIDASDAGVIIDGSEAGGEWTCGLVIQSSFNRVSGLEIRNFSGAGILLPAGADENMIGGDRSIGGGPFGQGNLIRNTSDGIGLRGSKNIISGNLIGTDSGGKEKWGNRNPGIFVEETASDNTIGPNNVIAYNGIDSGGGVEFRSPQALGNRVTQNNIHDNASPAIFQQAGRADDSSVEISAPLLLDYDLKQGSASGISCPGCTLEFFTTAPDGNDIFEGSQVADLQGNFTFQKTGGFQGQGLKATAYIEGQNTSEFSIPTAVEQRTLVLQGENDNPRSVLPGVPYKDLEQNRIGTMHYVACDNLDNGSAESYANQAIKMGYRWVRVNVDWYDWAEIKQTGEYSDFSVTPCQDKAIDTLYEKGIPMLYTIVYWDPDLKLAPGQSRFATEEEIERFLEYTRFIVEHFKGRIAWYSILNEPNLVNNGQGWVKAEDYIKLVRRVIPLIREIDPQVKIIIGEVCPLNQNGAFEYLRKIVASDVVALADGIDWHNSSELSPDYNLDYYQSYPLWIDDIESTAAKNGFKGQFFSTEYQWRTENSAQPIDGQPWFYSNAVSGKYTARGLLEALGRGYWVTIGHENYESIPETVQVIKSLTGLLGGAQPLDLPLSVSETGVKLRQVAFRLPDGSRLTAIWNDTKAVDLDPGQAITLTLAGETNLPVVAIDPLYGYRQELVSSVTDAGLTIENFLLKDYPILLRLQP